MDLFAQLELMPGVVSRVFASLPAESWRVRSGPFAFVEHCWHLADLERERFGSRIEELVAKDDPFLPDFNGEKMVAERQYLMLPMDQADAAIAAAGPAYVGKLAPVI